MGSESGENTYWVVARAPAGKLTSDDFECRTGPIGECGHGEVVVKVLYLSIDAANRAWLQGATYRDQIDTGQTMAGFGLGQVVESRTPGLAPGDLVLGDLGWQTHARLPATSLERVDPIPRLSHHLSLYGITGLTAHLGLARIGRPEPGETLVVSAAAGATGNLVGQIGRLLGCRVVGICGSEEKVAWLTGPLGFDAAVSHRDPAFADELKAACPSGIDVYFDNVGGPVLESVLRRMNLHGRIVCCGVVSQYDTTSPDPGPRGVPGLLVTKRIRMEGFIVSDLYEHRDAALVELRRWVDDGSLVVTEDVLTGIESAPDGILRLLAGANVGKQLIHVADPDPVGEQRRG
jgi:NADPH-dependent curcumin reductase CurA